MMSKKKRNGVKQKPARQVNPLLFVAGGLALIVVAALVIFGGAGDARPAVTPEVIGAPSLKVDKERVDLGNVRLGQMVNVSFELANVGDRQVYFTGQPYVEVLEGC